MDCTSSLLRQFVNEKISCAETKCKAIAINILTADVENKIKEELNSAHFCGC